MKDSQLDDARASDPVERLLEESWESRDERANRRELDRGGLRGGAVPGRRRPAGRLGAASHRVDAWLALLLVGLYALVATAVRFPFGAGYVVPTYVILVPMLLLLPPSTVPLLTAAALVLGSVARWTATPRLGGPRAVLDPERMACRRSGARADARRHAPRRRRDASPSTSARFSPAASSTSRRSTLRESFALAVDADAAAAGGRGRVADRRLRRAARPAARARRAPRPHRVLLMVLPVSALLLLLERDRSARIAQAQHRLELVARERTRLQARRPAPRRRVRRQARPAGAVEHRAERLDRGARRRRAASSRSTSATDRRWSRRRRRVAWRRCCARRRKPRSARAVLQQLEREGVWALAVPLSPGERADLGARRAERSPGAIASSAPTSRSCSSASSTARTRRSPRSSLTRSLREQALTDALTGLGNRRKLAGRPQRAPRGGPRVRRRHARADALRPRRLQDLQRHVRPPRRRRAADAAGRQARRRGVAPRQPPTGSAATSSARCCRPEPRTTSTNKVARRGRRAARARARRSRSTPPAAPSCSRTRPTTPDYALQLADERMYERKRTPPILGQGADPRRPDPDHARQAARAARALDAASPGWPCRSAAGWG